MRRSLRLGIATVAALGALANPALADKTVVKDQRNETAKLRKNGRVDIVRASAGHRGQLLEHKVVVRARIKRKRKAERPLLGINVRGGNASDPEYMILGTDIFKNRRKGKPIRIGDARLRAQGKKWTYRFDPAVFPKGGLGRYGWVAFTSTKQRVLDLVPANRYQVHKP